jgi:hypothetical protein
MLRQLPGHGEFEEMAVTTDQDQAALSEADSRCRATGLPPRNRPASAAWDKISAYSRWVGLLGYVVD